MSQKPFDPFRYNADTVPPLLRKDLARLAVPELSPAELEPPPELKQRLASLSTKASARVTRAILEKRGHRAFSSRRIARASIVLFALATLGPAFVWLYR